MMLAQAANEGAHAATIYGGVIAIVSALLMPFIRDWMKDRRERENDARAAAIQERIANSNEQMNQKVGTLTTQLAVQATLQDERHRNNLAAMNSLCKADCGSCRNFEPVKTQQPK